MRPPRPSLHVVAACIVLLTIVLPVRLGAAAGASTPLVVVVGRATGITDVTLADLRRAFQGGQADYAPGKRLVPFNLPVGAPERVMFDQIVLGLGPDEVGRFWINRRIRDEGLAPRIVTSSELGIRVVASYPGAITYMRARALPASVRVLTINGVAPGQPDYLFPNL